MSCHVKKFKFEASPSINLGSTLCGPKNAVKAFDCGGTLTLLIEHIIKLIKFEAYQAKILVVLSTKKSFQFRWKS